MQKELNIQVYQEALKYLNQIKPEGVDLHPYFIGTDSGYDSLIDVFKCFIDDAQNYQRLPNVIAYRKRESKVREILQNYDLVKISRMNEDDLYHSFRNAFDVSSNDSKQNLWYKWACSVIDSARFVSRFENAEDFDSFVRKYDTDLTKRKDLALYIKSQIRGVGFAVACNILKDLGYLNYSKPDVHLIDVFHALGFSDGSQEDTFDAVAAMAEDCRSVDPGATPYKVDKVFWLICSGYYYLEDPQIRIGRNKDELIEHLLNTTDCKKHPISDMHTHRRSYPDSVESDDIDDKSLINTVAAAYTTYSCLTDQPVSREEFLAKFEENKSFYMTLLRKKADRR